MIHIMLSGTVKDSFTKTEYANDIPRQSLGILQNNIILSNIKIKMSVKLYVCSFCQERSIEIEMKNSNNHHYHLNTFAYSNLC